MADQEPWRNAWERDKAALQRRGLIEASDGYYGTVLSRALKIGFAAGFEARDAEVEALRAEIERLRPFEARVCNGATETGWHIMTEDHYAALRRVVEAAQRVIGHEGALDLAAFLGCDVGDDWDALRAAVAEVTDAD